MAPFEIMRRIKGRTSLKLFEEFPHIKKRYWGDIFGVEAIFVRHLGK
jgi:putative transposase